MFEIFVGHYKRNLTINSRSSLEKNCNIHVIFQICGEIVTYFFIRFSFSLFYNIVFAIFQLENDVTKTKKCCSLL